MSWCGATCSATCSLDKWAPCLNRSSGVGEYKHEGESDEDDVLLVPGVANFVECVGQGVLAVGLECEVEVDCGVGGRGTKTLPVGQDGVPRVPHTYITPKWCRSRHEVGEGTTERIQSTEGQR